MEEPGRSDTTGGGTAGPDVIDQDRQIDREVGEPDVEYRAFDAVLPDAKALFMTVWCPDSRSVESNCGIPRG